MGITNRLYEAHPNPPFGEYRANLMRDKPLESAIAIGSHGALHGNLSVDARDRVRDKAHLLFQRGGMTALATRWLEATGAEAEAKRQLSYEKAVWNIWLGDQAAALEELEIAEKARPFNLIYAAVDPGLTPLRREPRFQATLRRVRLPVVE